MTVVGRKGREKHNLLQYLGERAKQSEKAKLLDSQSCNIPYTWPAVVPRSVQGFFVTLLVPFTHTKVSGRHPSKFCSAKSSE
jgi:hypothetical protein